MTKKIRVGIVGLNPKRGFASIAHVPALRALPDFEIVAVATTRQESADAAASMTRFSQRHVPCAKVTSTADPDFSSDDERLADECQKGFAQSNVRRVAKRFVARVRADPQVEPDNGCQSCERCDIKPWRLAAFDAACLRD